MDSNQKIELFRSWVDQTPDCSIVFLGGAGVSTESGIPDFRSSTGVFSKRGRFSPEEVVSARFFRSHTEEFFEFYRRGMIVQDALPNQAHIKLAELEAEGKLSAIITQNIDGLHQMAGSKNVLELHGSVHRNYCMDCGKQYPLDFVITSISVIPYCTECGGIVRPDVVLYQEQLDENILRASAEAIENASMLIVGGTSLVVYPAAGLTRFYDKDRLVIINMSETPQDNDADLHISESIGKVFNW